MLLPSDQKKSVRDLMGDDGASVRQNLIELIRKDNSPPPSTNDINIWELERCIREQSTTCEISIEYRSSTLVLTGDGTVAVTALHDVRSLLRAILKDPQNKEVPLSELANKLDGFSIPAFIYNATGKMISTPSGNNLRLGRLRPEQIQALYENLDSTTLPTYLDSATLSASKSLGVGLKVAGPSKETSGPFKIFGYPGETTTWKSWGLGDSDGHSMFCSVGTATTPELAAKRVNSWEFNQFDIGVKERFRNEALFIEAPSYHGMSGGPVLNERGELVGIVSSGNDVPLNSITASTRIK